MPPSRGVWGHAFKSGGATVPPAPPSPTPLTSDWRFFFVCFHFQFPFPVFISSFHFALFPAFSYVPKQEMEMKCEWETEVEMQPLSCCSPNKIPVLLAFVPSYLRALPTSSF